MKKKTTLLIFFILISITGFYKAQNKGVAIGKANSEPSAILDVASSNVMTTGSGATATATVSATGQITGVTVTNGGTNYNSPVQVSIYGMDDTFLIAKGARATATIVNGVITAITVTNGGANYVAGKTAVSITTGHKAVVIPRVNLLALTNGTSPVNGPKDGVTVFNNPGNPDKSGVYFWNSDIPKWDRGIPYIETGKSAIIEYTGTDQLIMNDQPAGRYVAFSSDTYNGGDIFKYNATATLMGLKSVNLNLTPLSLAIGSVTTTGAVQGSAYCINAEYGSYKFEVTFYFTAPAPDFSSVPIDGTSPYYYMGYLTDCYLIEYDLATSTVSSVQPTSALPYTPINSRLRKEYGVISKIDTEHRMTQIYSFNVPKPTAGKGYALFFRLGRMSGSGIQDQFSFSRSRSYIKVNKY